jgi:proteasome beta subunit
VDFKTDPFSSSFYDFLAIRYPYLLPGAHRHFSIEPTGLQEPVPHGTTVLAVKYQDGVLIAGDRMATEGFQVSGRRIEKVYKVDEHSAIAIAGAAGPCIELARLFQTEMEHYEKLEGVELSTEGKANKLSQMIKANLPMAFQGLIVIPLFVGYDLSKEQGRIFKYDITGGRYEETDHYATGSGGKDARNTLKKFYKERMNEEEAVRLTLEALYDAADEDIGTGGPDLIRGIYPTVKTVTGKGITDVEEERIKRIYTELLEARKKEA